MIGTRGFPYIQGGVEKHCEHLYPLLAQRGCNVKVFRRAPYIHRKNALKFFRKVQFSDLWTLRSKNLETIVHSFMASIICLFEKPDIVHIHNIGPSLVLPLLKLAHLNTVVTYHSANYEHEKWGSFAKKILMMGERFTGRWADQVVFVSKNQYESTHCLKKVHIPNGVNIEHAPSSNEFLSRLEVLPGKYILAVGRFVPEKGLEDLIRAFMGLECGFRLVIVGDADYETNYSRSLRELARADYRIILAGYVTGEPLAQVYSNARLFVLPSHQEGLPLALLEAMGYGLSVLASDIPANKEIGLPSNRYFKCGDIPELKKKMELLLEEELSEHEKLEIRNKIIEQYNWEKIADQTIAVYQKVVKHNPLAT